MKLNPGMHVKIIFKNGFLTEGFVESWENDFILKSLSGDSLFIIPNPKEDIMAIKIFISEESKEVEKPTIKKEIVEEIIVPSEAQDISSDLRIKKLAELRMELVKQERQIIANRLRDHHIGDVRKVEYGLPGIFKKPST